MNETEVECEVGRVVGNRDERKSVGTEQVETDFR